MWSEVKVTRRVVVLLASLGVAAYVNALAAGFTFDDEPDIRNNPTVTEGVDLIRVLASPLPPGDLYRPLTVLTFAINEKLMPGVAAPFHAVNVLLHAGVTLLVFWLAVRLFNSARIAGIAAVLFALHPIHTEAVTSLVGRAEVLAALFGLSAVLSVDCADRAKGRVSRAAWRTASVTSFSLALLSKESALTVLPLILLLRVAQRAEPSIRGLLRELRSLDWIPYALCACVFLGLRHSVVGAVAPPLPVTPLNNILAFVPCTVRLRSAMAVLWDYFGLLNVPLVLSADYSYNQVPSVTSWLDLRFLAGVLLVAGVVGIVIWHPRPAVRFATAFPLVALLLTANVLFPIGTIKAERLLYLPSVGWTLLVGYAFDRLLRVERYRRAAVGALCITAAAFGARTWVRNWDWRDNTTLYRSMLNSAPDSAKSRYNFGVELQLQLADEFAVPQFRRALAIYPRWSEAALGIGIAYQRGGRVDEAVEWYEKALKIEPEFSKAHTNLCYVLANDKRFSEAERACRQGLRYDPSDTNLMKMLGFSMIGNSAHEKGVAMLRRVLVLSPRDEGLRNYLMQRDAPSAERGVETAMLP